MGTSNNEIPKRINSCRKTVDMLNSTCFVEQNKMSDIRNYNKEYTALWGKSVDSEQET